MVCVIKAHAQTPIPSQVLVEDAWLPAKNFSLWKEKDRENYNGTYYGEIGDEDNEASLTINYQRKTANYMRKTTAFLVSGIYKKRTPYMPDTIIVFKNAFSPNEAVADIGPFSIIFVTLNRKKGAIIGNIFLPKEK